MNKILKVNEIAERIGATVPYTREMLRNGTLKGRKVGREWIADLEEVNKFLGVTTNEEEVKKDFYIQELESKIKHLEFILRSIKGNLNNMNMIIE